jgi:hypothetical protein
MLTDERRAEIETAIKELEAAKVKANIGLVVDRFEGRLAIRDLVHSKPVEGMIRELLAEIDRLKEAASDSSELAATTIAGLEREVASLQMSLKVHIDGERRLRAEVFRLRAERESNERRY